MKRVKLLCLLTAAVFAFALVLSGCDGLSKDGIYVRVAPDGLGINAKPEYKKMNSLSEAKKYADDNKIYGSIVIDGNKKTIYAPCGEVGSEILYQAKIVCDFIRDDGFVYGNAPLNPAFDFEAHIVSCDRLVDWVLYRVGFTDQPYEHGKCVSGPGLTNWCIDHNFTKISDFSEIQPGDVIFVRPNGNGDPLHVFINAGPGLTNDLYYRYDGGSDQRLQSTQPSLEVINDFMYAYRAPDVEIDGSDIFTTMAPLSTFDPGVKYTAVVRSDFEDDKTLDWKALNQISGFGTLRGALKFRTTGTDPQLEYTGELGMDCSEIDAIRIRMINTTYSDTLQIYFTTDKVTKYSEKAVINVKFERVGLKVEDDQWLEVLIDPTVSAQWKGKLTGLRLDPVCGKGEIRIDYISLDKKG